MFSATGRLPGSAPRAASERWVRTNSGVLDAIRAKQARPRRARIRCARASAGRGLSRARSSTAYGRGSPAITRSGKATRAPGSGTLRPARRRLSHLGGLDDLGGGGDVHDGGHLDVLLRVLKVTERVGMAGRSADRRRRGACFWLEGTQEAYLFFGPAEAINPQEKLGIENLVVSKSSLRERKNKYPLPSSSYGINFSHHDGLFRCLRIMEPTRNLRWTLLLTYSV